MLCWRRISANGTPASPCFRISTIWLSVNRDFRMGISLAPESLRSKCLLKGEAYADAADPGDADVDALEPELIGHTLGAVRGMASSATRFGWGPRGPRRCSTRAATPPTWKARRTS